MKYVDDDPSFDDEAYEAYYRQQAKEEAAHFQNVQTKASICPRCNKVVGEADFLDDDPSVGIFWAGFENYCEDCNVYFTTDMHGEQEQEDA